MRPSAYPATRAKTSAFVTDFTLENSLFIENPLQGSVDESSRAVPRAIVQNCRGSP